jgi:tripartite-type tricarboxylate transporter receptor subunit TctC
VTCSIRMIFAAIRLVWSFARSLAILLPIVGWTTSAGAEDYPSRTVTIIVPYPAGGPTDQVARILAQKLSEKFGQSFVVENLSGGGTTIATTRVARAAPDGYVLLLHNLQISALVSLYPNMNVDVEKDLVPVGFINFNPLLLVGRKSLEANSLDELLTWMKSTPAKVAHFGAGSTAHLTTALFTQEAKISVDQIPYRGAAPALTDLIGGHVDLFFATPQQVFGNVTAGQIKAFAITAKDQSPQFPTAASMVQKFGPKLDITYWHAMFAPAGTPKPIVEKVNGVLQAAAEDPMILKLWADTGVKPYPRGQRSPEAAQMLLRSEIVRWGEVVRDNKIQPAE